MVLKKPCRQYFSGPEGFRGALSATPLTVDFSVLVGSKRFTGRVEFDGEIICCSPVNDGHMIGLAATLPGAFPNTFCSNRSIRPKNPGSRMPDRPDGVVGVWVDRFRGRRGGGFRGALRAWSSREPWIPDIMILHGQLAIYENLSGDRALLLSKRPGALGDFYRSFVGNDGPDRGLVAEFRSGKPSGHSETCYPKPARRGPIAEILARDAFYGSGQGQILSWNEPSRGNRPSAHGFTVDFFVGRRRGSADAAV